MSRNGNVSDSALIAVESIGGGRSTREGSLMKPFESTSLFHRSVRNVRRSSRRRSQRAGAARFGGMGFGGGRDSLGRLFSSGFSFAGRRCEQMRKRLRFGAHFGPIHRQEVIDARGIPNKPGRRASPILPVKWKYVASQLAPLSERRQCGTPPDGSWGRKRFPLKVALGRT